MAGRGPAPKATRTRPTDQRRRQAETTVVEADGELRGPELPDGRLGWVNGERMSVDWPQATVDWWETWRSSPMTKTWTTTDWNFLLDTALLHAQYWSGDLSVAAELRLRVAKFGATPEDRARLKLEVAKPADPPSARPAQSGRTRTARKARILRVVDGEEA